MTPSRISSFYWFPSVVNFPGIDGILFDGKDIYLLQATISNEHRRPDDGLKKVWEIIGAASSQLLNWHFVVITDIKYLAEKYVTDLGAQLPLRLGRIQKVVGVWGCFLEPTFGPQGFFLTS